MKKMNTKKSALALTVTAAIPFGTALAQQENTAVQELETTKVQATEEAGYKVDETSSVKLTQPIANTPRSINVISERLLEDQGITNLNDALRNVAGVSTFGGGEGGGGVVSASDKVTIRGFDARSNIYVDGIRDIAGYSRDTFNYEAVEVIKGGSGSLDGRSTGGGSVNLATKRARLEDFGAVSGRYDSFENARVTLDYNKKLSENVAGRLNLLYSDGGDFFDNGVEEYQTTGAAGSLLYKVNEATDINLDVFVMEQDNVPVLGLPFLTSAAAEATGQPEGPIDSGLWDEYYSVPGRDFEEVSTQMYTLVINHKVNDVVTLRSQTRFGSNEKESVIGRPWWNSGEEANLLNAERLQALDEETDLFVSQLDAILSLESGALKHRVVLGAEVAEEERTSFGVTANYTYVDGQGNVLEAPTINPFDLQNNVFVTGGTTRSGNDTSGDASTVALYLLDTIKVGEHLQVDINARYDDFDISGSACGRRSGCFDGLDAQGSYFSYGAAVSYMPTENVNIYLSHSNSKQPPGVALALSTNAAQNAVRPENAVTTELGVKWQFFNDQLLVSGAVFETTKDVVDSQNIEDGVTVYSLAGEQESKGYEVSVTGMLTDSLSISANYASLDTEVTQDTTADSIGNGLQASPDDTANIWVNYAAMDNKLNVGGGIYYNSGETYWRRNTAYFTVDSYTTLFLMASYQVTEDLKLQLNVDNLTDEEYVVDYSAKGHFRPGNPRSVAVFANYTF